MIAASQAFKDAVKAGKPQRAMLRFADAVFTNDDISITSGGISFHDRFNEADELRIGACPESSLNVSLINRNGILNDYAFGRFTGSIGALIEEGTFPPSYITQAAYGQTTLYARASKPYLLENSSECSIQPDFPVKSIAIDDGRAFLFGEGGRVAAFDVAVKPHAFLTNPEQYISNTFMKEKVAGLVAAHRGIAKAGQYVTEWYSNGKTEKYEYVKLGEFIAQRPAIVRRRIIDLEAGDYMQLFADKMAKDVTFSYPTTLSGLVSQMCSILGVKWAQTDFINSSISVSEEPDDFKEATLQEILAWVAQAGCCYAKFNRDGKLEMRWFNQTDKTFGETDYSDFTPYSYQVEKVDKLYVRNSNSTEERAVGNGDNAYLLQNNPFLRVNDDAQTQSRARARAASTPYDKIYDRLSGFEPFSPSTSELFTDWTTEAGDVVNVTSEGETYSVPVYSMDMEWKGSPKVTLSNSGEQKRDTVSKLERQEYTSGKNDYALSRGVGGLSKKAENLEERLSYAEINIDEDNAQIQLIAGRVDKAEGRISSAEITLNGSEGKIGLVGRVENAEGRISSAEITLNGLNSEIELKADKITLNGYVTANQLKTEFSNFESGISDNLYVRALSATNFECNSIKIGGTGLSLVQKKVVTGVSRTKRYVKSPSDVSIEIYECSGVSTDTIYYASWE